MYVYNFDVLVIEAAKEIVKIKEDTMDKKKCSIIISVYNSEKYIQKTIESCLKQTYENIEIIIIDDCSTDNSIKIIEHYDQAYENIIMYTNQANHGFIKSSIKGVSMSKGDYILILGHDDMLEPNHVEKMLEEFDKKTALVFCNANIINERDEFLRVAFDEKAKIEVTNRSRFMLSMGNIVHSTGAIINKSYYEMIGGFDPKYNNYGEWLLWIKLNSVGKIKYNSKVRALYRRHETNMTNLFDDDIVKIKLYPFFIDCQKTALALFSLTIVEKLFVYKSLIRKIIKLNLMKLKYKFTVSD